MTAVKESHPTAVKTRSVSERKMLAFLMMKEYIVIMVKFVLSFLVYPINLAIVNVIAC